MTLDIVQADSLLSGTFAFSAIVPDSTGQPKDLVGRRTLYGAITEIPFSAIELEFIYSEDCGPWRDSLLVGEYMPDARAMNDPCIQATGIENRPSPLAVARRRLDERL